MTLNFVEPGEHTPTWNVLLYGPPGTGKTVGACSAPGPVLVVNAEGPDALFYARKLYGADHVREVRLAGSQTLDEVYLFLRENKDFRTVVLDTVGEAYRILLEELIGSGPRASLQNYGDVNTKLGRFIRALRDLNVNVVLVAHEQIDDADNDRVVRPDTGGKKLPEQVMAQMGIVAYTGVIPETDEHPRRYVGQIVEANGRRAKDRSGALGKTRDLNLTEWIEVANKATTPAASNGAAKTKEKVAA